MILLKAAVAIIIFYTYYYVQAIGPIPSFLIFTYLLLDISLVWYVMRLPSDKRKLPIEAKMLILFYVITFLPGLLMSPDASSYIDQIKNGIQYTVLFIAVFYIVRNTRSINYVLTVVLIASSAFAVTIVQRGVLINDRLAISQGTNANVAGFIMVMGIFIYIYFFNKGWIYKIAGLLYTVLSVPAVFQTGSRKALLAMVIFALAYTLLVYLPSLKKKHIFVVYVQLVLIGTAIFIAYQWVLSAYTGSIMFSRMESFGVESEAGRILMYARALEIFQNYPFFGVGYWNYAYYSGIGLYSHSTYGEVLASTGLIGFILWFGMYISIIKRMVKVFMYKWDSHQPKFIAGFLSALFIVELFFGTGTVQLYDPIFYVFLSVMLGFCLNSQEDMGTLPSFDLKGEVILGSE